MAQKRMFDKSVVCTDNFLDMPATTQNLYFHLSMVADDDGFVDNWRSIMKMCGNTIDDMKLLIAKSYVIPFESGVIVIKHWRLNNFLRKDRHIDTKYQEELSMLSLDENNGYVLTPTEFEEITFDNETSEDRKKRIIAYNESDLPYSFGYKIRQAFRDKQCPVCGNKMSDYKGSPSMPTIQHNIPISKGGKHELNNISVICKKCNVSLRDTITGNLNNKEVIEVWEKIVGQPNIGQPRIDKNRIDNNNIYINNIHQQEVDDECEIPSNDIKIPSKKENFNDEFEQLWNLYPKKQGKKDALRHYITARKKGTAFEQVKNGIDNYNNYIKAGNISSRYIKQGSSWFNQECWNDEYDLKKPNMPEWVDKKIEEKELTKEEEQELNSILDEFREE